MEDMFENRLAEETIYVVLSDQKEIEIAKKQKWITEFTNDNSTVWEYDHASRQKLRVEKHDYVSLQYFRYMTRIPVNVFIQLERGF